MSEQKTLADLRAGDEVAIHDGIGEGYSILNIKSISRGIIELQNGNKYRVSNGTPLAKGEKWYRPESIGPVTEQIRQINKQRRLASKLNALNINDWKKMNVETLETIAALIWKPE